MFQLYCTTEGVSWYHGFYATYDEADTARAYLLSSGAYDSIDIVTA